MKKMRILIPVAFVMLFAFSFMGNFTSADAQVSEFNSGGRVCVRNTQDPSLNTGRCSEGNCSIMITAGPDCSRSVTIGPGDQ